MPAFRAEALGVTRFFPNGNPGLIQCDFQLRLVGAVRRELGSLALTGRHVEEVAERFKREGNRPDRLFTNVNRMVGLAGCGATACERRKGHM